MRELCGNATEQIQSLQEPRSPAWMLRGEDMNMPDRLRSDWNLEMVGARSARAKLLRAQGRTEDNFVDWGDMRVAHLDTGYTEHPGFGFREGVMPWLLVEEGLNLLADGHPIDPLDYDGNPGHGTRTCSILCGDAADLPGEPAIGSEIGVAPRLPVVPCRVTTSVVLVDPERQAAVAKGIRHAVRKRCQVISISLGSPFISPDSGLGQAVDEAYEAGVIIVAAGGQVVDRVCYPGKFKRTIGVGGVTHDRRAWHTYGPGANWTDWIDVWAPAEDVLRLDSLAARGRAVVPPSEGEDPDSSISTVGSSTHSGKSGKGAGTSFATVHVAAAAAMWLLMRMDQIRALYNEPWQRVEAFRWLLRHEARSIVFGREQRGRPLDERTGIIGMGALMTARLPRLDQLQMKAIDARMWQ